MRQAKNIVILHGWGSSVAKFEPLAKNLDKKHWNTLTLKLPGFDLKPPTSPWTLNDYANYIEEKAIERFGKAGYYLFGHSFGARIAIKIASSKKPKISGLILCSAPGISRTVSLKRYLFLIASKMGKLLLGNNPHPFFRKMLYKFAREHDYEKTTGVMKQTMTNVVSEDLKPIVPIIKQPTLILWGDRDKMTPVKDAYYIKSQLPKSLLKIFNGYGHRVPYDIPEEIAAEIDSWYKQI